MRNCNINIVPGNFMNNDDNDPVRISLLKY